MFLADDVVGMLAQLNQEADQLLLRKKAELQQAQKTNDASQAVRPESTQPADSGQVT